MSVTVVEIPHGYCDSSIRLMLENLGIFMVHPDIPKSVLDAQAPQENFNLWIYDEAPDQGFLERHLGSLTISQTLWAIAYMNCELADVVREKTVRFFHEPFEVEERSWRNLWTSQVVERQLFVKSREIVSSRGDSFSPFSPIILPIGDGQRIYLVNSVPVNKVLPGSSVAYILSR